MLDGNIRIGDEIRYIGVTNGILTKDNIYLVNRVTSSSEYWIICDDNVNRWVGPDFYPEWEKVEKMNDEINFLDLLKGY